MSDQRRTQRARRIGLNETVFREVNERLSSLGTAYVLEDEPLDLICECGNVDCVERIRVTKDDYEAIRSDPAQFAVVAGHAETDLEDVIEARGGYEVVRKKPGEGRDVARQRDPR
jgi:hypothetical protein